MLTAQSNSAQTLSDLLSYHGWTRIAVLHDIDESVQAIKYALEQDSSLDIVWIPLLAQHFPFSIQNLVKCGINVVVILHEDPLVVRLFLEEAASIGMVAKGMAFIVVGPNPNSPHLSSAPVGTIFIESLDATPSNITLFQTMIQSVTGFPGLGAGSVLAPHSIQAYDAILALADALERLNDTFESNVGDRLSVLTSLKAVDMMGYSGRIQFDESGFRPSLPSRFINMQFNSTLEIVMYSNGTHLQNILPAVFPGGTEEIPANCLEFITLALISPFSGLSIGFERSVWTSFVSYILNVVNNDPTLLPANTKMAVLLLDDQNSANAAIQLSVPLPLYGIAGVIGGLTSRISMDIQNVVSAFGIPQLSYAATSTALSQKDYYPTFMRNVPPDTYQVEAFVDICIKYNWKEVSVINTEDAYGSGLAQLFSESANKAQISIARHVTIPLSATNYDDAIRTLRDFGSKIVLGFVSYDSLRTFHKSVETVGFKPSAWLVSDSALGGNMTNRAKSLGLELNYFDGWMGVSPSGGHGPKYEAFKAALFSTADNEYPGAKLLISFDFVYACSLADAVFVYADAIKRVMEQGGNPRNGSVLLNALYQTDTLLLTGRTRFDSKGDRIGSYSILNVRSGKAENVGRWSAEAGLNWSSTVYFMDGTSNIPISVEPRSAQWLFWHGTYAKVFAVLAGIGLLISILMILVVVHQRTAPPIATATWQFLVVMLLGACLGYGSVFTWLGEPKAYICAMRIWLPPMAFILIMAPLLAKTWRLHRIFTVGSIKLAPFQLWKLTIIVTVLISFQMIICLFWITLGAIKPVVIESNSDQKTSFTVCPQTKANRLASFLTYGYLGIITLIGAYYAFRVRNLPKDFNESRWIAFSLYNTLLFSMIIIVLGYALSSFPNTVLILICVSTLAITTGVVTFMLVPKMWTLLMHPEKRSGGNNPNCKAKSRKDRETGSLSSSQPLGSVTPAKHDYSLTQKDSVLDSQSCD